MDHKAVVQERIDHIGKLSETVNTTEALYAISKVLKSKLIYKEMAKLESEAFELKQKVAFNQEVKATLDSWVRQEAAVREAEQAKLVAQVMEAVKTKLADPKTVIHLPDNAAIFYLKPKYCRFGETISFQVRIKTFPPNSL